MQSSNLWSKDAIERVLSTVIQVVLAAALTAFTQTIRGTDATDLDTISVAIGAGYAAALAALKAWIAKAVTDTLSPASLAKV